MTQVRTGQPVSVTPCQGLQPHLVSCSSLRTSAVRFEIDEHEVGVVADGDAAFADDVPHAGRGVAHPVDDLLERAAAAVDFVEHQGERILDGRQAGRRCRVGLLLFFERVRRVVGGDDLDAAVERAPARAAVVVGRLERRIHLDERAEPGVVVDVEQQMMRAGLGGDEAAMIGKQLGFGAGRNVQHVEAVVDGGWPGRSRGAWR